MSKTPIVAGGACALALLVSAGFTQGSRRNPVTDSSHLQELTAISPSFEAQETRRAILRGSYFSHLRDLIALKDYTLPLAHAIRRPQLAHHLQTPKIGHVDRQRPDPFMGTGSC